MQNGTQLPYRDELDIMPLGPRHELDTYVATFYLTLRGQSLNVMLGRPRRFCCCFFLA